MRSRPFVVRVYSTRGGTSAKVSRRITPSSSKERNRSERVFGLMPCRERSSWLKRLTPEAKSRIISSVHLPLMILAVRATGQAVLPVFLLRVTDVVVESIVLHSYDEQRGSRISYPLRNQLSRLYHSRNTM